MVTAENDGVLLYKTSLSSLKDVVNDDEKVNLTFFRSWRASQNSSVKFAHPCVYDRITKTYFGCTKTASTKRTTKQNVGGSGGSKVTVLSWRDDQTNYHASIDDAAAGGKTSFGDKTVEFFASFDGGCVIIDGEEGNLHIVDSDGAIVGTVEAKDVDDDEEEEEEETTTRTKTRRAKQLRECRGRSGERERRERRRYRRFGVDDGRRSRQERSIEI